MDNRIIYELDLDRTKFNDELSAALKDILAMNEAERKAKLATLDVMKSIQLAAEAYKKAQPFDATQAAQYQKALLKIEKTQKRIASATPAKLSVAANTPDPLTASAGKQTAAITKAMSKEYKLFSKIATGEIQEVAKEIIELANAGKQLEGPDQYAEELGKAEVVAQTLKSAIGDLRKENKKLIKEGFGDSEAVRDNAKQVVELENELKKLGKATRVLKKDFEVFGGAEDDTLALEAQLKRLRKQYNALGRTAKKTKEGIALRDEINDLANELNDTEKGLGSFFRQIGDYRDEMRAAAVSTEGFGTTVQGTVAGARAAFTLLAAHPILAFFAILSAAVAGLASVFFGTEEGSMILQKAFNGLRAIMDVVSGTINSLIKNFKGFGKGDAIAGVTKLGKTIYDLLLNPLLLVVRTIIATGKAIKEAATGNVANAKEALNGIADDAADAAQRISDAVGSIAGTAVGVVNAFGEIKDKIVETNAALNAFDQLVRDVAISNAGLTVEIAKATREFDKLAAISDDDTRSFGERIEAADKLTSALARLTAAQVKEAKNNLAVANANLANVRNSGKDSIAAIEAQADAQAALIDAEAEGQNTQLEQREKYSKLISDKLEIELDAYIDYNDRLKQINLRLIGDDSLSIAARRKLLADTEKLDNEAYRKQIETLQQTTDTKIDIAEFENAQNADQFLKRLRQLKVSEIFETRSLEIFRERITSIDDLKEATKALNEAEQARIAARKKNVEDAERSVYDITLEIETARLNLLRETQETQTSIAEIENEKQLESIRRTYEGMRQAAIDKGKLFPADELAEYLAALDELETRAVDGANVAFNEKLLQVNEQALQRAIKSVTDAAASSLVVGTDRIEAEQITALTELFSKGEIKFEEYQRRLTVIQKNAIRERQNNELNSLTDQLRKLEDAINLSELAKTTSIVSADKILSAEATEETKKRIEELKTAIAQLNATIATGEAEDTATTDDALGEKVAGYVSAYQQIEGAAIGALKNITAAELESINRSIEGQAARIETAKEFFRAGNEEYLQQEEERNRELLQKREKAIRRQQFLDRISQISSVLTGLASTFASGNVAALPAALAGLTALFSIVPALIPAPQNFYKGTEFVNGKRGIDKVPANLTRGERVIPASTNEAYQESLNIIQRRLMKPDEVLQRLTNDVPVFNIAGANRAIETHQTQSIDLSSLEGKIGLMVEAQEATNKKLAALGISVRMDEKGFAASIEAQAKRKKALRR